MSIDFQHTRSHMYTVKHTDMPPYDVTVFADLSTEPWSCRQTLGFRGRYSTSAGCCRFRCGRIMLHGGTGGKEPILKLHRPASLYLLHSCRVFLWMILCSYIFFVFYCPTTVQKDATQTEVQTNTHSLTHTCDELLYMYRVLDRETRR